MSNKVSVLKSGKKNFPWYVSYPDGGKRCKKYFKKKERKGGADEWARAKREELAEQGAKHAAVTDSEMQAIIRFRDVVSELPQYAQDVSLLEAVEDYAKRLEARHKSITCSEVAEKLVRKLEVEGKSQSHIANVRSRLNRFTADYGDWLACDVSTEIIDDFLTNLNRQSQTIIHYRRAIGQLFKYAVTLKAAPSNPIDETIRPKVVAAATEVLSPDEVGKLLKAASPKITSALAISFFGGVRRAEIERLEWSEIDLEDGLIEIKAQNAKSAQRRFVPISDNLRAWLDLEEDMSGKVVESAFVLRSGLEEARKTAEIKKWPHNAGRHSFASYHLAHHEDAGKLALALGHPDPSLLYKHYRKLVTPKKATQFWSIVPDTKIPNVTSIKSA